MDTATKTAAAQGAISSASMSPDEARRRYYGLGKVEGGDTPYLQVQNYSLRALAKRDAGDPFAAPAPMPKPVVVEEDDDEASDDEQAASLTGLLRKELELAA
jgi:hypothetical protein